MPKLIEIRKLAALDMAWLGARVVVAEYALGVVLPLALGGFTLWSTLRSTNPLTWQTVFGIWLLTIAANYVPLFLFAISIAKAGTVETEGRPEKANAHRYAVQQAMILVPFLVIMVAIIQERRRQTSK